MSDRGTTVPRRQEVTQPGAAGVLDQLPLAVTVLDRQGHVGYLNAAAEKLYGRPSDDMVGRSVFETSIADADAAAAADVLRSVLEGDSWSGQFPVTRPDGSGFVGAFHIAPVHGPDGEIDAVVSVCHDVSAEWVEGAERSVMLETERLARREAEAANQLFESVLANAPVGLAFFDRELHFVRVNEAIAAINGVPAAEHLGRTPAEVLGELAVEVEGILERVIATGRPVLNVELAGETRASPGVERMWRASYYPVTVGDEVAWVGAVIEDITVQRRAEMARRDLLEIERRVRSAAERSTERLRRLQAVTARLGRARDRKEVATVLCEDGAEGIGANSARLVVLAPDRAHLELVASRGYDPSVDERFERVSLDEALPSCDAVRNQSMVLLQSLDVRDQRYPALIGTATRNQAHAVIPIIVGDQAVGALSFGFAGQRDFDDDDRRFLGALADQAGQTLERVRLDEAERVARRRQEFLAEASVILASSLDYQETLRSVSRLCVPEMGDSCSLHLVIDGELRMVTAAHVDPDLEAVMHQVALQGGGATTNPFVGQVADTAEPVLAEVVPPGLWRETLEDSEEVALMERLGITSALAVPLVAPANRRRTSGDQRTVLGVVVFTRGERRRPFRADHLQLAATLADRSAIAIDNARAHRANAEAADSLQRSLLPPGKIDIPGLEVAARYAPVGDGSVVGGDYYDLFHVADERWAVVIGDVCGQGVAAAAHTALLRYTIRAAARIHSSPAEVLRFVNDTLLADAQEERFSTACVGILDLAEPSLLLASGGHHLPLLVAVDGSVRPVGLPGTALGLLDDAHLVDVHIDLQAGDRILLYTDGVVEARNPAGAQVGEEFLESLAAELADRDVEGMAGEILDRVLGFEGGDARDDIAVLVVQIGTGAPTIDTEQVGPLFDERWQAIPSIVPEARQAFDGWLTHNAVSGAAAEDLLLAVTELVTNAVRAARTAVQVRARLHGGAVELEVADDGPGFDASVPHDPISVDPLAERGRGLFIVRSIIGDPDIDSGPSGTTIRCRLQLGQGRPAPRHDHPGS